MKHANQTKPKNWIHLLAITLTCIAFVSNSVIAAVGAGTFTNDDIVFVNDSTLQEIEESGIYYIRSNVEIVLSNGTQISKTLADVSPFTGAIIMSARKATNNVSALDISGFNDWTVDFPPVAMIPCDGREVTSNWYPALSESLSTLWGTPANSANFVLPYLANFHLRGAETMGGGASNTDADPVRDLNYNERHLSAFLDDDAINSGVGTFQDYQVESHHHTMSAANFTTSDSDATSHYHKTADNVFVSETGSEYVTSLYQYINGFHFPLTPNLLNLAHIPSNAISDSEKLPSGAGQYYRDSDNVVDTITSGTPISNGGNHNHSVSNLPTTVTLADDGVTGGTDPKNNAVGLTMYVFAAPFDLDGIAE